MDPETQQPMGERPKDEQQLSERDEQISARMEAELKAELSPVAPPEMERGIFWVFVGEDGLRAGWSVVVWVLLMLLLMNGFGYLFLKLGLLAHKGEVTPKSLFFNELLSVLAVVISMWLMSLMERRRIWDYNLRGTHRLRNFIAGLAVGFAGLSALVGGLAAGGWLHFGGEALAGAAVLKFALIWAGVFLLVACFEEGTFRCYLLATLTRGINFWWSLGTVAFTCGLLAERHRGNGVWGDYALALLGLLPCLWLHLRRAENQGFWQAAWVTSTLFGFVHTSNGGESWIGIFAAGAIGFVFCVSIRVTGSAWWAIGAHQGWDWGETYFYGTPDSGMVAPGHYLNTTISGNALWSGGQAGPEGSLLVLAVIALMLVWVLVVYGRRRDQNIKAPRDLEGGLVAGL